MRSFWVNVMRRLHRCWRDPLQRAALVLATLAIACFALLAGPPFFSTASQPQRFDDPNIEVQTVHDIEDLRLTLGEAPSQDREAMRIKLYIDFAFIPAYAFLLATLGALLTRQGGWKQIAGIAAAICGLAAGVFDLLENLAILAILDLRISATSDTMLTAIRRPSSIKWTLAAVSVTLLLSYFVRKPKPHEPAPRN
ncbi:MAG: hypothetical protein ABI811_19330 [Acidobacteriota bacterium]